MDREARRAAVHGVAKSQTWLRDWTEGTKDDRTCVCLPHHCMHSSQNRAGAQRANEWREAMGGPRQWDEIMLIKHLIHRTGKGQFSFQAQRRAMPKNVHTTTALISHASKVKLKIFKLGLSSTWTENFQMYKLGFKEAEEPEIKLPTFVGSWRKQRSFQKNITSSSLTTLNPLTVWITTNCGEFLKSWE